MIGWYTWTTFSLNRFVGNPVGHNNEVVVREVNSDLLILLGFIGAESYSQLSVVQQFGWRMTPQFLVPHRFSRHKTATLKELFELGRIDKGSVSPLWVELLKSFPSTSKEKVGIRWTYLFKPEEQMNSWDRLPEERGRRIEGPEQILKRKRSNLWGGYRGHPRNTYKIECLIMRKNYS